jgi:hypothetical protein
MNNVSSPTHVVIIRVEGEEVDAAVARAQAASSQQQKPAIVLEWRTLPAIGRVLYPLHTLGTPAGP